MSVEIELTLRDAFGKLYMVEALSKKRIEKILENLDIEEVVKLAYGAYCPNLARGVCELDIRDGHILNVNYTQGSGDIRGAHYIELYSVPQNLDIPTDELFTDEDFKKYRESEDYEGDYGIFDWAENHDIDIEEREITALCEDAYDYFHSREWKEDMSELLDEIYKE